MEFNINNIGDIIRKFILNELKIVYNKDAQRPKERNLEVPYYAISGIIKHEFPIDKSNNTLGDKSFVFYADSSDNYLVNKLTGEPYPTYLRNNEGEFILDEEYGEKQLDEQAEYINEFDFISSLEFEGKLSTITNTLITTYLNSIITNERIK